MDRDTKQRPLEPTDLRTALPSAVAEIVERYRWEAHPGLLLDKYVKSVLTAEAEREVRDKKISDKFDVQRLAQRPEIDDVVAVKPPGLDLADLAVRRRAILGEPTFIASTVGPLTMHLSRAGTLENAGLCLHPIYGFAYLPGTGLTGLARAYPETVAKPAGQATDADIRAVFGWTPEPRDKTFSAGSVVFHDAWPLKWPKLVADIVNNHHPSYYQNGDPPGDWDNPNPVYFLAVPADTEFEFTVKGRQDDTESRFVELARTWLLGGLVHLGAGAKTAAGYGYFVEAKDHKPQPRPALAANSGRAVFECTLELTSPAFLAGASQDASDCDLRSATLRGQLRWWWRTLHAGHLSVEQLRSLKAAIWGDTKSGSAVTTVVARIGAESFSLAPRPFDKAALANMTPAEKVGERGVPEANPQKTTQGLWYMSFGMDETVKDKQTALRNRRQRHYLDTGAKWRLVMSAREAKTPFGEGIIPARDVLKQAKTALWLLCRYGGVGAKCRKGFGSLGCDKALDITDLAAADRVGRDFRALVGLHGDFREDLAASPALGLALREVEVRFDWPDVWAVLDQAGVSYQAFSQGLKHDVSKRALGLPRKVGAPTKGRFDPTGPVKKLWDEAIRKRKEDDVRHASPLLFHLDRTDGGFLVRVSAFPAAFLPKLRESREMLDQVMDHLDDDLVRRSGLSVPPAKTYRPPSALPPQPPRPAATAKRENGTKVKATFRGKDDKGKLIVQEEGREPGKVSLGTPPNPLPAEGSEVTAYIKDDAKPPQYT